MGICAGVCLALMIFAMQTKWDFTAFGGILFVCVIVLLVFGIVAIIIPGKTISMIYASLGALLFSCYLVFDFSRRVHLCCFESLFGYHQHIFVHFSPCGWISQLKLQLLLPTSFLYNPTIFIPYFNVPVH